MTTWTIRRRPDGRWAAISLDPTGGRHIITYPTATAAMTALDPRNRPRRHSPQSEGSGVINFLDLAPSMRKVMQLLTAPHDRSHYTLEA